MIVAIDVSYDEDESAVAAAVVFKKYPDTGPVARYTARINKFGKYVPGQFFRRELPCLLAVLAEVNEKLDTIIIDGYVMLGQKPGLGYHLWEKLYRKVAVIGVAKTLLVNANPIKIHRGKSNRPLYITSIGMNPVAAAEYVSKMYGSYRIPELLKQADNLARNRLKEYNQGDSNSIDLGEE